jgi:hypothetical protein
VIDSSMAIRSDGSRNSTVTESPPVAGAATEGAARSHHANDSQFAAACNIAALSALASVGLISTKDGPFPAVRALRRA